MNMLRNVFALIVGVVTAGLIIMAVEWTGHQAYPPPADFEFGDSEQTRAFMATLPTGAILFVGLAWAAGAFFGTVASALVGTLKPLHVGVVIGGFVLAGAIFNLIVIPHPWWFTIAAPIGILLATFGAIRTMERFRA